MATKKETAPKGDAVEATAPKGDVLAEPAPVRDPVHEAKANGNKSFYTKGRT